MATSSKQRFMDEGLTQGGLQSLLLSNVVLDELDWEFLEWRGLPLERNMDDSNIYVLSRAGQGNE